MTHILKKLAGAFVVCAGLAASLAEAQAPAPAPPPATGNDTTCQGKFPNPLTDICWSCMLPLKLGSVTLANLGNQEDTDDNPTLPICSCVSNPTIGLTVGFWEPARHVEVVRKPFCLMSLGGVNLNPGIDAPEHARSTTGVSKNSFYQVHYYANPVVALLNAISDFPCLEQGGFDMLYMTEVDPTWDDDSLASILAPEAILFANPVAEAACAADCIKSSTGFGYKNMFWCAGCQGSIYPLNGNVSVHGGGIRTAELLVQRTSAKLHRELISWGYHGRDGLCGPYYEPLMDKTAYKTQLMYPIPATQKLGALGAGANPGAGPGPGTGTPGTPPPTAPGAPPVNEPGWEPFPGGQPPAPEQTTQLPARCCQPFGRTTALWGAGKEYPAKGEDFSFMLFRKRNCCVGY